MTANSKSIIESTFRDSIMQVCKKYALAIHQMTLQIRFTKKGKQQLDICVKDKIKKTIPFDELMHPKMLGIRFNTTSLKTFFGCIHHAFMLEKECINPKCISLIFYQSKKLECPCIGVMQDDKPIKALRIADIFDAMDLGEEQLN